MRIISRYVLKVFFPVFFLTLSAFLGIYLIIDFFEKADDLLEKQADILVSIAYFAYKIPTVVAQGIPMATLMATLITLGILNRNREIIAFKAAGLNAFSYAGPILFSALFLSIVDFTFGETVARYMNQKSQEIWRREVMQTGSSVRYSQENVWYRGQSAIYEIRHYDRSTQALDSVSIFYLDPQFRLTRRLDAKRLRWQDNKWIAENGLVMTLNGTEVAQEWFTERVLDLQEKPEDFGGIATIPEELDWLDLYNYTEKIRQEGYNAVPYEVELHVRAAFPMTALILALLGVTIALRQGPQGGIAFSVGIALIVAFIYLTGLQVGCSMASAGILPAFAGVWTINALVVILGSYLWTTAPQ
jgi:lipopolysaccharide export system permease protein